VKETGEERGIGETVQNSGMREVKQQWKWEEGSVKERRKTNILVKWEGEKRKDYKTAKKGKR
jgi:hypothetical protein